MQSHGNHAGIRVRHSRSCSRQDKKSRCNCRPTFEAWAYSPRDRKKIRRSFPTLGAAKSWRKDAVAQLDRGAMCAPTSTTLRAAAGIWLAGARDGSIRNRSGDVYKPSAIRSYEIALRTRVLPDLGTKKLSEITRADLQRLIARMQREEHSASTIRNTFMPVRSIYRDADVLVEGGVPVNPTMGLRLPAVRGRRDRIASPEEAGKLIAAVPARDRALWATAFYAGLRAGELRALDWSHVDLASGVLRVERAWDAKAGPIEPKSQAGRRSVPVPVVLRDYLVEHRMLQKGRPGLVFGTSVTQPFDPPTVIGRADREWKRAGLDRITLHEARHTFASLMIAAGVNAKALSTYMGHASVTITLDRYGHLMPGSEDEAAALLDMYLERASKGAQQAVGLS